MQVACEKIATFDQCHSTVSEMFSETVQDRP